MGHIRSQAGRFDNRGNPGQQIDTDLLQHAPNREVVRINVDGHTALGHTNVMPNERPFARQHGWVTIHEIRKVRQLLSQAGVREQRANAPFDVNPGVRTRRTGVGTPLVELFLVRHQMQGQGLQHAPPFLERHLPQMATAHLAGIRTSGRQVDVGCVQRSNRLTVDGIEKGRGVGACRGPFPRDQVVE